MDYYADRYRRLGLKIAYYRKLNGWTQAELAEKIGRSTIFVSQVESQTKPCGVSLDTLFRLADLFRVDSSQLLTNLDD